MGNRLKKNNMPQTFVYGLREGVFISEGRNAVESVIISIPQSKTE